MINGPAVGSGTDMALHCDIRLGCEYAFHRLSTIGTDPGKWRLLLPAEDGWAGAGTGICLHRHLDAERAFEWGLLNYLVPSEKLEETTRALCDRIMRTPPMVQWISKRIMRAALDSSIETTMMMTSNAGGILQRIGTHRKPGGPFLEKRKPTFKGR